MSTFREPHELPRFTELEADYEIQRELGRGGTAVVYLARERELGRQVAIKVIRAAYVEDGEAAARLVREARMVGGLQHPNIVVLYGTRRLRDGSLALIMQFVPGRTLKEEIRRLGPLPFERTEQVLADMARALGYAHRQRIVHRDIKPENIYVDDESGIARLSDFGIARPWDADSGLTLPGTAIGTPAYMSPEQIDGSALDGRSDLYSLGMVGYEMLTGTRPWAGESLFSVIYKQKHETLRPLPEVRAGVPARLVRAIEGALRKDPAARWRDADAFLEALDDGRGRYRAQGRQLPDPAAPLTTRSRAATEPGLRESVTVQYRRPVTRGGTVPGDAVPPSRPSRPAPEPLAGLPVSGAPTPAPALPGRHAPAAAAPAASAPAPAEPPRRRPVLAAAMLVALLVTAVAAAVRPWGGPAAGSRAVAPPVTPVPPPVSPQQSQPPEPRPPAVLYPVLVAGMEGAPGDTLRHPLMVRIEDENGAGVPGVPVRFRVTDGTSEVLPAEVETDSTGIAVARWLVHSVGMHRVEATTEALPASLASFTARAAALPAVRLVGMNHPDRAAAVPGATVILRVRAEDERGEAVPGARVRFDVQAGGGRLDPATVVSGTDGVAEAAWSLGASGAQSATARLVSAPNTTISFNGGNTGPAPLPVRAGLFAGGIHSCSLASDGALACWGGNDRGQLGDGSTERRDAPVAVAVPEPLASVAAGVSHTCAVSTAAVAYCWGNNGAGQLGDGSQSARSGAVRVAADVRLASVFVGSTHSCGLAEGGALYCWGDNTHGQVGDGSRTSRSAPVRVGEPRRFRAVALGWSHTCGIDTEGTALCWGRNAGGQLGDGGTGDRSVPGPVAGAHRFSAIAAGSGHTCGLRSDGAVLCWGQNSHGQLGNGSTSGSAVPVAARIGEPVTAVSVGALHSCGVTRGGTALCWGRNVHGQLGDGTTEDRAAPAPVAGGFSFTSIVASGAHTCGSAAGSGWHCWGYNLEGQLGDGSRENRLTPGPVVRRQAP